MNMSFYVLQTSPTCLDHLYSCVTQIMAELDLAGEEAADWFSQQESQGRSADRPETEQPPRLYLLLGDSVAKASRLTSRVPEDRIFNRANGGESWRSLLRHVEADLEAWLEDNGGGRADPRQHPNLVFR